MFIYLSEFGTRIGMLQESDHPFSGYPLFLSFYLHTKLIWGGNLLIHTSSKYTFLPFSRFAIVKWIIVSQVL